MVGEVRRVELVRGLGAWASAAIVVGTMIGTGIFLKPAEMAREGWVQASLQPVIATPIRTSNALANTMRVIAVTQHLRQAPRE